MPTVEKTLPARDARAESATTESTPGGKHFHDFLNLATKILPVAGAVGTLFVWLAANFYVGDVQIAPDRPFNSIEVKVSDKKGQENIFHTPKFQLMPGDYHVQIAVDSTPNQHADVKVAFHHKSVIPVVVSQAAVPNTRREEMVALEEKSQAGTRDLVPQSAGDDDQESVSAGHRHWWQFWKRTKRSLN